MDLGVRCDRHVGEVFPPRCSECDALQRPTVREPEPELPWAESKPYDGVPPAVSEVNDEPF